MDIAPWCISGGMVWDGYLRAGWGTEHRTDLVKPPMTVASQRPIADWVLLLFSPFAIWCKDIDEDDFVDDFYRYSGFDGFMATVMMIIVIMSTVFIKLMNCDYRFNSLNIDVKNADLAFKTKWSSLHKKELSPILPLHYFLSIRHRRDISHLLICIVF